MTNYYKLESVNAFCVEDLPKEIAYHYQYQTKENTPKDKNGIIFPLKSSKSLGGKHLLNMYNFPPSGMKNIRAKDLFRVKGHVHSRHKYAAVVELGFDEKGNHCGRKTGYLYFCEDNFGYAVLNFYDKEKGYMQNGFYVFGCIDHNMVEEVSTSLMVARRCSKCGFFETHGTGD